MMKLTLPDGTKMTFAEALDKKGVKSEQQSRLKAELKKGEKAEPMQTTMDKAVDGPARKKGVAKPTPKKSSKERLADFIDSKDGKN